MAVPCWHFGPPECKACQADVCSNTFMLTRLRMGPVRSLQRLELVSRLVPKKALVPLQSHRGRDNTQQRVLESSQLLGRKQKGAPELISCMKRGRTKTGLSPGPLTQAPPRHGDKTTGETTPAVRRRRAGCRQTLKVWRCLITADTTFLLFKPVLVPANPQPSHSPPPSRAALPGAAEDPVGQCVTIPLKKGIQWLCPPAPVHFGVPPIAAHTTSCKKGCPQSLTSRGRSLSVKPRSGEQSSSSFSLLLFMQDACRLCLACLPSPWGSD